MRKWLAFLLVGYLWKKFGRSTTSNGGMGSRVFRR